jgi:hypothetical protein
MGTEIGVIRIYKKFWLEKEKKTSSESFVKNYSVLNHNKSE